MDGKLLKVTLLLVVSTCAWKLRMFCFVIYDSRLASDVRFWSPDAPLS